MSSLQMVINYRQGIPTGEAMGYYDTQSSLKTHRHLSGPCWACFPTGILVSVSCWDVMTAVETKRGAGQINTLQTGNSGCPASVCLLSFFFSLAVVQTLAVNLFTSECV